MGLATEPELIDKCSLEVIIVGREDQVATDLGVEASQEKYRKKDQSLEATKNPLLVRTKDQAPAPAQQ